MTRFNEIYEELSKSGPYGQQLTDDEIRNVFAHTL